MGRFFRLSLTSADKRLGRGCLLIPFPRTFLSSEALKKKEKYLGKVCKTPKGVLGM